MKPVRKLFKKKLVFGKDFTKNMKNAMKNIKVKPPEDGYAALDQLKEDVKKARIDAKRTGKMNRRMKKKGTFDSDKTEL